VLIQRLSTKYGVKFLPLVTFFVDEFVATHEEITSSEINILEKEVHNAVRLKNVEEQNSGRNGKTDGHGKNDSANSTQDKKVQIYLL
jgi:hypothetical protein